MQKGDVEHHPVLSSTPLGQPQTVSDSRHVPRQTNGGGRIIEFHIYVGDNPVGK
jgi:hypothetical protein